MCRVVDRPRRVGEHRRAGREDAVTFPDLKRIDERQRLHRPDPPVTLRACASPINQDWFVRTDGWCLPEHFPVDYPSLEAAQRAADDMLINHRPHDCRRVGCGEWVPVEALTQSAPQRSM